MRSRYLHFTPIFEKTSLKISKNTIFEVLVRFIEQLFRITAVIERIYNQNQHTFQWFNLYPTTEKLCYFSNIVFNPHFSFFFPRKIYLRESESLEICECFPFVCTYRWFQFLCSLDLVFMLLISHLAKWSTHEIKLAYFHNLHALLRHYFSKINGWSWMCLKLWWDFSR